MQNQNLLTTQQLADLLRLTPGSIRNRLSSKPSTLPASIRLKGFRKHLFRIEDVQSFLDQGISKPKKLGRPTKRQQLEKKLNKSNKTLNKTLLAQSWQVYGAEHLALYTNLKHLLLF